MDVVLGALAGTRLSDGRSGRVGVGSIGYYLVAGWAAAGSGYLLQPGPYDGAAAAAGRHVPLCMLYVLIAGPF